MKKICKTCNEKKDLSEFHKHLNCKFKVRNECKKCRIKKQLKYQKNNKEAYLEYQKKHYSKNKKQYKKYAIEYKDIKNKQRREKYANDPEYRKKILKDIKSYHKKNPLVKKRQSLKNLYNLSLEDFDNLLKKQNDSCAICKIKNNGNKRIFPFVDHCHKTNKIRGILCINCNQALGKFKDNIQFLKNAIKYLKENNGK